MDEWEALNRLQTRLPEAGDDAAVVDGTAITIDMLHETTDFPAGMTHYSIGWRTAAVSLSDLAAMGADPQAVVAAYAPTTFDGPALNAFVAGATAVCNRVDAAYVGGDLDQHTEFTTASAAVGSTENPVFRSGASPGELVCVTGTLGRTAGAITLFADGSEKRANELFQFLPRIEAGMALAEDATAMIDSSDGLARSVHQLAAASGCGIALTEETLPIADVVAETTSDAETRLERGVFFGGDFELVFTLPPETYEDYSHSLSTTITKIGTVTEGGVTLDGTPLPNRGYDHG